jgi:ferredoxin
MPLKIHVDPDKCQGHARCKSLAPELFNLDEYGNAHEIGSNCPEIAIEITED